MYVPSNVYCYFRELIYFIGGISQNSAIPTMWCRWTNETSLSQIRISTTLTAEYEASIIPSFHWATQSHPSWVQQIIGIQATTRALPLSQLPDRTMFLCKLENWTWSIFVSFNTIPRSLLCVIISQQYYNCWSDHTSKSAVPRLDDKGGRWITDQDSSSLQSRSVTTPFHLLKQSASLSISVNAYSTMHIKGAI